MKVMVELDDSIAYGLIALTQKGWTFDQVVNAYLRTALENSSGAKTPKTLSSKIIAVQVHELAEYFISGIFEGDPLPKVQFTVPDLYAKLYENWTDIDGISQLSIQREFEKHIKLYAHSVPDGMPIVCFLRDNEFEQPVYHVRAKKGYSHESNAS